jgi:hypothetical protein
MVTGLMVQREGGHVVARGEVDVLDIGHVGWAIGSDLLPQREACAEAVLAVHDVLGRVDGGNLDQEEAIQGVLKQHSNRLNPCAPNLLD